MTQTILVAGGGGYLGSVLVGLLLQRGCRVRVFDRLFFGREPLFPYQDDPRFELVVGDIRRVSDFPDLFKDVDAVFHLAGLSNDPAGDLKPGHTWTINVEGTRNLIEGAVSAGVPRLLFASSCSVYGAAPAVTVTEDVVPRPVSVYAETKVAAERILLDEFRGKLHGTVFRFATLFGCSPRMRFDLAINLMALHAVQRGKISVMGGGKQWRPLLHVRDAARACSAWLDQPASRMTGQVFNVGVDAQNCTIAELAQRVAETIGQVNTEATPDDPDKRSYKVSFEKVRRQLGFSVEQTIEDGAAEVAAAVRRNDFGDCSNSRFYSVQRTREVFERPALDGGEPVRSAFLPFALPLIGREEEEEVLAVLRSGWLTTGPRVQRFEKLISEYVGVRHAVAVSSCTAALHLALAALEIGPGDEVLVPAITFPATANAVLYQGAKPVLVDVDPETLNIDLADAERRTTAQTRAILPVHMAGQPCDMEAVFSFASRHGLKVVEDAAHALGATYRGRPIGSLPSSAATCFSFYPIKNMTTIEGGVVTTEDDRIAERIRLMSLHGISKDAWKRYARNGTPHWETMTLGYKYNMSDVQAAVGIPQLAKLEGFLATRERYARIYREELSGVKGIQPLSVDPESRHAWHLFIVKVRSEESGIDRDGLIQELTAENVGTGVHFRSLHLQSFYRETLGCRPEDLPAASTVSDQILSLPLYPKMTEHDVISVIEAVKKIVGYRSVKRAVSLV